MRNEDVHQAFKKAKVKKWVVAEMLETTDVAFSKRLRTELSSGEKEKIFHAIEKIKNGGIENE